MTTDICSIWSYHEIVESGYVGERQAMFLSVFIKEDRPLARVEANEILFSIFGKKSMDQYEGKRISELEQMGYLEKYDLVVCEKSKKTVNRWKYTGRKNPKKSREEKVDCPQCKGFGHIFKTVWYDEDEDYI